MSEIQELVRATAGRLFDRHHTEVTLATLQEMGWDELVEAHPAVAVAELAEEQGRALGSSRLVELEVLRSLHLDPERFALAFPLLPVRPGDPIDALLLADAPLASRIIVPMVDGVAVTLCDVSSKDAVLDRGCGIDSPLGLTRATIAAGLRTHSSIDPRQWASAAAAGHRALCHELLGVTEGMLSLAVGHVSERRQFGVPIGTFQAVQHRLANVHVAIAGARALLRTAWLDGDPARSAAALAAGLTAADIGAEECHQVMGAIGCTWEHEMHWYLRRGVALGLLFDPAATLDEAVRSKALTAAPIEVLA